MARRVALTVTRPRPLEDRAGAGGEPLRGSFKAGAGPALEADFPAFIPDLLVDAAGLEVRSGHPAAPLHPPFEETIPNLGSRRLANPSFFLDSVTMSSLKKRT